MTSRMTFADLGIARSFHFAAMNKKSVVTFCLIGIMLFGAVQYLGALYAVFSIGLRLQTENRQIRVLGQEVDALELKTQRASANFPVEHKDALDSMEKISQVRYLTGGEEAVSYISSR